MNKHPGTFFLFLLALSLASFPTMAAHPTLQEADRFLQENEFAERGVGTTNALLKLDGFLAKSANAPLVRRHLLVRKIALLKKINRSEEAYELFAREFISQPVMPKDALEAYDELESLRNKSAVAGSENYRFAVFLERLLANPAIAKDPAAKAAFHLRYARLLASRSCNDLAVAQYQEAARLFKAPEDKANALFEAAIAARKYRGLATSEACLDEIEKIPELPYIMKKRLDLLRGENAIFQAQHSWTPGKKELAEATRYIDRALDLRSPLLGTPEATRVLFALIRAQAKGGDRQAAAKRGVALLDGPTELDWDTKGSLAVCVGDTYYDMGDYKKAVKFYERGLNAGGPGPKQVELRIAKAARAGKDYFRAMQAYSDAIKYCDPVDGQDEIAHLTGLVSLMNKSVRKGASSVDSEDMFSDGNDDLGGLTLDEE